MHYQRAARTGGTDKPQRSATDRFWSKVDRSELADCWPWTAGTSTSGYGRFWTGRKRAQAHRYAYEQANGPIPDGLHLDHLCRNRACVNPDHLEPVTPAVNQNRGLRPRWSVRTACKHGHDITDPANVYLTLDGRHCCRVCMRAAAARYRARRHGRR